MKCEWLKADREGVRVIASKQAKSMKILTNFSLNEVQCSLLINQTSSHDACEHFKQCEQGVYKHPQLFKHKKLLLKIIIDRGARVSERELSASKQAKNFENG